MNTESYMIESSFHANGGIYECGCFSSSSETTTVLYFILDKHYTLCLLQTWVSWNSTPIRSTWVHPGFLWIAVQSLVVCLLLSRSLFVLFLFFCSFCIVCHSIYGFWLPLGVFKFFQIYRYFLVYCYQYLWVIYRFW